MTKAPHALTSLLHHTGVGRRARSRAFPGSGAPAAPPCLAPALICTLALLALLLAAAPAALAAPPSNFATAGQGVAVDQSNGTVYVADNESNRVVEFESDGTFIRAFGGGGLGGIRPNAVAVDDDPASPSFHDLYVSEYYNGNYRILKFTPAGEFLLAFGWGVATGASELQTCGPKATPPTATCQAGLKGAGPGQIGNFAPSLALDPSGNVWVGDAERLEQFSPTGAFLSQIAVPGAEAVGALAIDTDPSSPSYEDFYAIGAEPNSRNAVGPVRKLSPTGVPIETIDESGRPNALGLDPAGGELFISDQAGEFNSGAVQGQATLLSYDSAGNQTRRFGHGQVGGFPLGDALAFGDAAQRLYVVTSTGERTTQSFALPPSGPYVSEGSLTAKSIKGTSATLNATLDPEGAASEYHFEYLTEAAYQQNLANSLPGFFGAATTPVASLPADFAEHPVSAAVTGLSGETTYHFRLNAENSNGKGNASEQEATFATLPPARIDDETVSDVTATSATLGAQINPLGNPTEYRFEYITEAAYLENIAAELDPFTGAASTPEGSISAGEGDQGVSQHLQGLSPHTAYRYRAFAHNVGGSAAGSAHVFITQTPGPFALPDARQWELVSPPDKHGARIWQILFGRVIQAAASGNAISYGASASTEAGSPGNHNRVQVLSRRTADGWQSRDISTPTGTPTGRANYGETEYRLFSADLSLGVVQRLGEELSPLSPEASAPTLYLRTDYLNGDVEQPCTTSCYRPLVTGCPEAEPCPPQVEEHANVPPGNEFGRCPFETIGVKENYCGPYFLGASPDLSHIVLEPPVDSKVALTETPGDLGGLYEWTAAAPPSEQLRLLSILPNGVPVPPNVGPALGSSVPKTRAAGAISDDGSRVVWSEGGGKKHLYQRDLATEQTVQLDAVQGGSGAGAVQPQFQTASPDGSEVFFTDGQRLTADSGAGLNTPDLYRCEILEEEGQLHCRLTDLTPIGSSGQSADVQGGLLGASKDGSSLYFAANGVLTAAPNDQGEQAAPGGCEANTASSGVKHGTCNLYRWHAGTTTLIAVLSSGADESDFATEPARQTARISPDGRWLAFMSQRSLTGYDNRDAVSARPDQEVFLYHAPASPGEEGKLVCASCNPTGARPHGFEYGNDLRLIGEAPSEHEWLAANIPQWINYGGSSGLYQPRYLSDAGRLFFNSNDGLVPQDSNHTEDVYQYEPPGLGDCQSSSSTFAASSGGCVDLVSSGVSGEESAFLDASETGDDVFFLTAAKLSPRDVDTSLDVYDARVGGGESEPLKPPDCSGDACQPPAVPPNDPTPGSLTFQGAGNVVEKPAKKKHAKKHKKKPHKQHKKNKRANSNRGGHK